MKRILAVVSIGVMIALPFFMAAKSQNEKENSDPLPFAFGGIHPRISPDGKTIVFSYQGAIWRVPIKGGVMTRLTDGKGFDHEPTWSPDGKSIAFIRGSGNLGGSLHMIRAEDGKERKLPKSVFVRGPYNFGKLEFSPDGNRILGVLRADGKDQGLAWYDVKTGDVQSLEIPMSFRTRYGLSPDGMWIVYTTTLDKRGEQTGNNGPENDLWRIPAKGGKSDKILRFPSRIYDICFHANGKKLIVVSELGGVYNDLWQLPWQTAKGVNPLSQLTKLTTGQADEDRPSISRDGKRLVYSDNRDGATAIRFRDLATGNDQPVRITRPDSRSPTGTLKLRTKDRTTKKGVISRVVCHQQDGKFYAPPGSLYRMLRGGIGHFYCEKSAELILPAGKYQLLALRGPEYKTTAQEITIKPGQTVELTVELDRWVHAAKNGWYSGENHIHANYGYGQWYNTPKTMFTQCSGEDLNVCNFMVANSDTDGIFDRPFFRGGPDPRSDSETILYWNQEFRSTLWGHMTLVNLKQIVEPVMTGFHSTTNPWDIPTNSDIADRTHWQKGHVNYTHAVQNPEHPFENPYAAKGLPIDVALGKIDSLDLNNAYKGAVPVWYRLLNCGFRLPPSAGTDCFLNRIFSRLPGGDRVYVKVPGGLTYSGWIEHLKKGHSFVSNGPMLKFSVDGKGMGETVKLAAAKKIRIRAHARSQYPLTKVELIHNGQVALKLPIADDALSAKLDKEIAVKKSGWLALRVSGPGPTISGLTPVFAHTAPIYIKVPGSKVRSKEDALFFLKWIDELAVLVRQRDRIPNAALRQHVEDQLQAARTVYSGIAREGS